MSCVVAARIEHGGLLLFIDDQRYAVPPRMSTWFRSRRGGPAVILSAQPNHVQTRRLRVNLVHLRNTLGAGALALCVSAASAQTGSPAASAPAPAAPATAGAAATSETGKIAWYGNKFAGRKTPSGEAFNPEALTMAHKTLPFGTLVKVTNRKNNKSVTLRVNDRGPTQADRIGDVSYAAARKLGMLKSGVIEAELAVVGTAKAKKR